MSANGPVTEIPDLERLIISNETKDPDVDKESVKNNADAEGKWGFGLNELYRLALQFYRGGWNLNVVEPSSCLTSIILTVLPVFARSYLFLLHIRHPLRTCVIQRFYCHLPSVNYLVRIPSFWKCRHCHLV